MKRYIKSSSIDTSNLCKMMFGGHDAYSQTDWLSDAFEDINVKDLYYDIYYETTYNIDGMVRDILGGYDFDDSEWESILKPRNLYHDIYNRFIRSKSKELDRTFLYIICYCQFVEEYQYILHTTLDFNDNQIKKIVNDLSSLKSQLNIASWLD